MSADGTPKPSQKALAPQAQSSASLPASKPPASKNPHAPKETRIEQGTRVRGTLSAEGRTVIEGQFDGEIEAPELVVAADATVQGTIRATQLVSNGTLSGVVESEDISLSGKVLRDTMIRTKALVVLPGSDDAPPAVTFGECLIEAGPDPYERRQALLTPAGSKGSEAREKSPSVAGSRPAEKAPPPFPAPSARNASAAPTKPMEAAKPAAPPRAEDESHGG